MSSFVNASFYQRTREFAELLDSVLVELKAQDGYPSARRRNLAALLSQLAGQPQPDTRSRLLLLVLSGIEGVNRQAWSEIGEALLRPRVEPSVISRLERLARELEQAQFEAVARTGR